jgi:hypothetical protein
MNEKVYEIAVDVADLAYPLQIEREIRLRSRLVAVCGKKAMRMAFTIEGRKNGKFGSACEFIDLPEGALLPDGEPVYRKMLDAFCKLWDRELTAKDLVKIERRIKKWCKEHLPHNAQYRTLDEQVWDYYGSY